MTGVQGARLLGEGWTTRSWLFGDRVLRCPKHADDWEWLHREIAFLRYAWDKLPLPVPRYGQVEPHAPGFAHGYAAYPLIPGRSAEGRLGSAPVRRNHARALADFLRALHDLRPPREVLQLLVHEDPVANAEFYRVVVERDLASQLTAAETTAVRAQLTRYAGNPANVAYSPVVLHADLNGDNILVDESGHITGVIDFGDVCLGDPDFDFTYLYLELGGDFTADVARRYGHPAPDALLEKTHYFALVDQIGTILCDGGRALPGHQDQAWQNLRTLCSRPL